MIRARLVTVGLVASLGVAAPSAAWGQAQRVFHATQSANLPTTQTLRPGDWLFEISHRFQPAASEGLDAFFGLDGGAFIRLGLAYSPADRMLFSIQRTNFNDNVDLNAKLRLVEPEVDELPQALAVVLGSSWDTALDTDRHAYYAQLVWNASINSQLAVGVAPSYVWSRSYGSIPPQPQDGHFALGVYAQLYVTRSMSVLGEWVTANEPSEQAYDSRTFGVEFQTRGHFFKLVATNQFWLNPTQYLLGSGVPFGLDDLRLGFNIQRLLPF